MVTDRRCRAALAFLVILASAALGAGAANAQDRLPAIPPDALTLQ